MTTHSPQWTVWDEATSRSPLLESLVALVSYAALNGGRGGVGDGIVPVDAAAVEVNTTAYPHAT